MRPVLTHRLIPVDNSQHAVMLIDMLNQFTHGGMISAPTDNPARRAPEASDPHHRASRGMQHARRSASRTVPRRATYSIATRGHPHTVSAGTRHTLALDLAEVFRPLFAERLLLRMAGRRQLKEHHFEANVNQAMLSDAGRKLVIEAVRDELGVTVAHRSIKRDVAYEELLYLDALQLAKTCFEGHTFSPFRIWW
jgi:hypothetical protein